MLPTSAFANSKDEWSSKWSERTHRTYLWTLGIQTGPSSLDKDDNENLDHDIISANGYKFHIYPSPRLSLQSDTIMTLPALKPPTPSSASDSFLYHSTRSRFPSSSNELRKIRHFSSCDEGLRLSLPFSPRQPRLVSRRSRILSNKPLDRLDIKLNKHSASLSLSSLEVPSNHARGRAVRLPSLNDLKVKKLTPAIILTPPTSPNPRRASVISFSSFISEHQSESASSAYEDIDSLSPASDESWNDDYDTQLAPPVTIDKLLIGSPENAHVPLHTFSESAFKVISSEKLEGKYTSIDSDEIMDNHSYLHPGRHGWVVPIISSATSSSQSNMLGVHVCPNNPCGSHIFLRVRSDRVRHPRYQYIGFYRVYNEDKVVTTDLDLKNSTREDSDKQVPRAGDGIEAVTSTVPGPRESSITTRVENTFSLRFIHFDWKLYATLRRQENLELIELVSAASGEIGKMLDYANPPLSHKKNERCSKRNDSSSIKRIVTEGGVDFEMTPLPVVWNHGSYKTQY